MKNQHQLRESELLTLLSARESQAKSTIAFLNQKLDETQSPQRQNEQPCKFETMRQEYFVAISELANIKKLINEKFTDFIQPDIEDT